MKKIPILITILILSFSPSKAQISNYGYSYGENTSSLCFIVGGVSFTAAALFEGDKEYSTYMVVNGVSTYTTKSFWHQPQRDIMFVGGITLTITGLIGRLSRR